MDDITEEKCAEEEARTTPLVHNVEDAVIATPERQRCYPRCSPPATATRRCFRRPGPRQQASGQRAGLRPRARACAIAAARGLYFCLARRPMRIRSVTAVFGRRLAAPLGRKRPVIASRTALIVFLPRAMLEVCHGHPRTWEPWRAVGLAALVSAGPRRGRGVCRAPTLWPAGSGRRAPPCGQGSPVADATRLLPALARRTGSGPPTGRPRRCVQTQRRGR